MGDGKNMAESWDKTFLGIASLYALHSTCKKHKVGAIIVRDKRVISTGYNGVAAGFTHCEEIYKDVDFKVDIEKSKEHHEWSIRNEIHAEQNCIVYAAKNGIKINADDEMFITLAPCINCAKLIVSLGIKRVVYADDSPKSCDGIDFLKSCGISVEKYKE